MSIPSTRPTKRIKKAPGPGKSRKVFSESLGISHLLSLVDDISTRKDSQDDEKVSKSKEWEKKRKEALRLKKLAQNPAGEKEKKRRKGSKPPEFQLDSSGRPVNGSNSIKVKGEEDKIGSNHATESIHSVKINTKAASKADIKSKLKAQARQKSKERKERRKAISNSDPKDSTGDDHSIDGSSVSAIVARLRGKEKAPGLQGKREDAVSAVGTKKRKRSEGSISISADKETPAEPSRKEKDPISVLKSDTAKKVKRGSEEDLQEKGKRKAIRKKRVSFA